MKSFDKVWELIVNHRDSDFKTKRRLRFKYKFVPSEGKTLLIFPHAHHDNSVCPSTSKESFEKAFEIGKCSGPGEYSGMKIGGTSYVWAILHDERINSF